jgi:hypothetical protein
MDLNFNMPQPLSLPSEHSDGAEAYWPKAKDYVYQPGDRLYHEKLASQWLAHHPPPVGSGKSDIAWFCLKSPNLTSSCYSTTLHVAAMCTSLLGRWPPKRSARGRITISTHKWHFSIHVSTFLCKVWHLSNPSSETLLSLYHSAASSWTTSAHQGNYVVIKPVFDKLPAGYRIFTKLRNCGRLVSVFELQFAIWLIQGQYRMTDIYSDIREEDSTRPRNSMSILNSWWKVGLESVPA